MRRRCEWGTGAASKLVLNLNGSTVATTADDWEEMKGIWRDAFSQQPVVNSEA